MQLVPDLIASKVAAASTGAGSAGKLVIGDGTLAGPGATGVLATLTLKTVPGSVTGAVFNVDCTPALTVAASAPGTASKAELRNSSDAVIVSGLTVGTSGTFDVVLTSTLITAGQTVTVTSGTITHG